MYHFYRWILNSFGFSRAQANGIFVLILLIFLSLFSETLKRHWMIEDQPNNRSDIKKLDSLMALWPVKLKENLDSNQIKSDHASLPMPIDPNVATKEALVSVGFPPAISNRIIAYRQKKGRFTIKKDVLKIYGMDSAVWGKVSPWLLLPDRPTVEAKAEQYIASNKKKNPVSFDLNKADTLSLKKVYGIGKQLSLRIVKYREALGGFVSLNQLYEIYGLDTVIVHELKKVTFISDDLMIRKMNINRVEKSQLASHPYLNRRAADAIVAYRFNHGDFNSLADLAQVKLLDSVLIKRMEPYLTIE